jgi:hypothetical protein
MSKPTKSWIQSYPSSKQVLPLDLQPDSINVHDVFWALSNKCRFTGHVKYFYSVAQHCVLGAEVLPIAWRLPFLLHEVSEAYLPDVSAPLKPHVFVQQPGGLIHTWADLEAHHADIILPAIGCGSIGPLLDAPEVKKMDLAMLAAEKEQLLGEPPADWNLKEPAANVVIYYWRPEEAYERALKMFRDLSGVSC